MTYIKKIYSGRVGRKNYFWGCLFFLVSFIFVVFLSSFIMGDTSIRNVILIMLWVTFLIHSFALHTRRFHDLGYGGNYSFLMFIPGINLAIILAMSLTSGEKYHNKYGDIPSKELTFLNDIFNKSKVLEKE